MRRFALRAFDGAAKLPLVRRLLSPIQRLRRERDELRAQLEKCAGAYAPGHFHSPVPDAEDVARAIAFSERPVASLPGIDLGVDRQRDLLEELRPLYGTVPFRPERQPGLRYSFDNPAYSYSDAIFLYLLIRHRRPRRIIEVGSGYSSCVMLDTNDLFFGGGMGLTFIEPHPEGLHGLMLPGDRDRVTVLARPLQGVGLDLFRELEAGDILFVDSSHVSKAGSDVNWLFFEILPLLKEGVAVHFHDVFATLEYPAAWLNAGRYWNEQYLLRAFLQYNSAFRVLLFNTLLEERMPDWFEAHMPDCLKNPGGSIWLERTG